MAEALAAVGVVASIVQLVEFSCKILHRLEEFQCISGEIPSSFRHIGVEIPVLRNSLQQTKEAIDGGSIGLETKKALIPVINGCTEQIGLLDTVLNDTLPKVDDSRIQRGKKALLSLRQDKKVESILKILRSYIGTLTFYYAAASSTLQPQTGS
jgi:N-terminal domain on NACHT_NTPase and P-loop NTPases